MSLTDGAVWAGSVLTSLFALYRLLVVRNRATEEARNRRGVGRKTIAIIGAGPSGLVAAKEAWEAGLLPTVFEKAEDIGGLWRPNTGLVWDSLMTNISRHTCRFSDFAWGDVEDDAGEGCSDLFPSAKKVHEYLHRYMAKHSYIKDRLHLNTEVVRVERPLPQKTGEQGEEGSAEQRSETGAEEQIQGKWVVRVLTRAKKSCSPFSSSALSRESASRARSYLFDFVAMTSGIFSRPKFPFDSLPGLKRCMEANPRTITHAATYRNPTNFAGGDVGGKQRYEASEEKMKKKEEEEVVEEEEEEEDGRFGAVATDKQKRQHILVIGNGFSGADISAELAMHGHRVVNAVRRPQYFLKRMVPCPSPPPSTIPLDKLFYDRTKKKKADAAPDRPREGVNQGTNHNRSSEEGAGEEKEEEEEEEKMRRRRKHTILEKLSGGNPGDVHEALRIDAERDIAFVCISENYLDCVARGLVEVRKGLRRVTTDKTAVFSYDGRDSKSGEQRREESRGGEEEIRFDRIICATGYHVALDFLSEEIKNEIQYDPQDLLQPVLLFESIFPRDTRTMAFIGMYRGPFWGAIELQARWAMAIFSGRLAMPPRPEIEEGIKKEMQIRHQRPRPQFPKADYVAMCESLERRLSKT